MDSRTSFERVFGVVAEIVGFACYLWFFSIVGYQIYTWLVTADWIPLPLGQLFAYFGVDMVGVVSTMRWAGLGAIMLWLIDLPVSVVVPVGMLFLLGAIASFADQIKTDAILAAQKEHENVHNLGKVEGAVGYAIGRKIARFFLRR